jgi:hypothetical protein
MISPGVSHQRKTFYPAPVKTQGVAFPFIVPRLPFPVKGKAFCPAPVKTQGVAFPSIVPRPYLFLNSSYTLTYF